jgi:predicted NBD/HSP70 family sugar kinase
LDFKLPLGKEETKNINKITILKEVYTNKGISKIELSKKIGLSPATISSLVGELIKEKYIVETGEGESSGGRKPVNLRIDNERGYIIGISVLKEDLNYCIMSFDGKIISQYTCALDSIKSNCIIMQLTELISELIREYENKKLIGIGISVENDFFGERILAKPSYFNHEIERFADKLEKKYNTIVRVENKIKTSLISEKVFGRAVNTDNFILLDISNRIAASLYVNGKIIDGYNNGAGNVGHIKVTSKEYKCKCGKTGCFEAVASYEGVKGRYVSKIIAGAESSLYEKYNDFNLINTNMIYDFATHGDETCANIVRETCGYIGIVLSILINTLNPEMILIKGMYNANSMLNREINKALNKHSIHKNLNKVYIGESLIANKSSALSAAALIVPEYTTITFIQM